MKKLLAVMLAGTMVVSLAACSGSNNSTSSDAVAETAAETTEAAVETVAEAVVETTQADEPDAGFEEIPIFEDEELDFINLSAVYFQPVPMESETQKISAEGYDLHLEADVSAMENSLGYGMGDWIPYLTVDYDVVGSDGQSAASGTFMTMAASDGPHYGANISLPNADTYSLTITIHSPGENGYLIHSDSETGPGGLLGDVWGDGPLSYTFEGWEYVPQEW